LISISHLENESEFDLKKTQDEHDKVEIPVHHSPPPSLFMTESPLHELAIVEDLKLIQAESPSRPKTQKSDRRNKNLKRQDEFKPLKMIAEEDSQYINYNDYYVVGNGVINNFFDKHLSKWLFKYKRIVLVLSLAWFIATIVMSANLTRNVGVQ